MKNANLILFNQWRALGSPGSFERWRNLDPRTRVVAIRHGTRRARKAPNPFNEWRKSGSAMPYPQWKKLNWKRPSKTGTQYPKDVKPEAAVPHQRGVKHRSYPLEFKRRVAAEANSGGVTQRTIASKYGICPSLVSVWMRGRGFSRNAPQTKTHKSGANGVLVLPRASVVLTREHYNSLLGTISERGRQCESYRRLAEAESARYMTLKKAVGKHLDEAVLDLKGVVKKF